MNWEYYLGDAPVAVADIIMGGATLFQITIRSFLPAHKSVQTPENKAVSITAYGIRSIIGYEYHLSVKDLVLWLRRCGYSWGIILDTLEVAENLGWDTTDSIQELNKYRITYKEGV